MAKRIALLIFILALALAATYLHRAANDVGELADQTEFAPARSRSGGSGESSRFSLSREGFSPSVMPPADPPASADEPEGLPPDAIPGEEVLMFYDDTHLRAFLDIAAEEGVDIVGKIDSLRAVRVRLSDASALRRALTRSPAPIARGPNHFVRRPEPPADPPEGVSYSPFGDGAAAWLGAAADRARWGEGITVAVLDTAVVPEATDGGVQVIDLVNEVTGDTPATHGTAVASIITGGDDVSGVAPAADILAVRVMSDNGVGNTFTLAQGVLDAVDRGARVINMSLGSRADAPVLGQAIAYAQQQGAVVVAAAGNNGREGVLYPARYAGVLSVGAVDADGRQMYFSNRGKQLDLVAPGLGVTAAGIDGEPIAFSGTSAATPIVAGALAGIWSESPELSGEEVSELIVRYADDAGAPGHDTRYGSGVLNVGRVLERDTPGIVDMVVARPCIKQHPIYDDELVVTLFAQNRGTETLDRVVLTANVDGAPIDLTFYDVAVGERVRHDYRLTSAGVGERAITIEQEVISRDREDRSPLDNRMISTLRVQSGR
ncbi:MAG: S8 family serine peptidase [Kiritimatiellia bacterium]|nr:S8 family serine peptidase [Kiritimatiellia bacterium]MDP6631818.1 S8 family serine peptidase [Kiritimatiellia bacterium]MDP6811488.1 S8 family serine peptidase [Kiritimatiellia bacterium]MDP7023430.1 S8 family serine peptidase [Kiritimatiellia bacterium]